MRMKDRLVTMRDFVCGLGVALLCLFFLASCSRTHLSASALLAPPRHRYHLHISSLSDLPGLQITPPALHLHISLIPLKFSHCSVSALSCSWVQTLIFHVFKGPVGKIWRHLVVRKYSANK